MLRVPRTLVAPPPQMSARQLPQEQLGGCVGKP
jgi:hypothetical protein